MSQLSPFSLAINRSGRRSGGSAGGGLQSFLLDHYPTASFAVSLRHLRTGYTGPALRVRRSSDSAEQDIGFVDGWLDTDALLAFVGAGDGFVKTWYDQSVNARHVSQANTSLQPYIVESGVVSSVEGRMGVYVDTVRYLQASGSVTGNTFNSCYAVIRPWFNNAKFAAVYERRSDNSRMTLQDSVHTGVRYLYTDGANASRNASSGAVSTTYYHLKSYRADANQFLECRVNGNPLVVTQSAAVSAMTGTADIFTLFRRLDTADSSRGWMSELVFFNDDQWANVADIESKIIPDWQLVGAPQGSWNSAYTSFLDTYTGAYSAYSLRILRQGYTGPLIRIRRNWDGAEKDFYAKSDGLLNTQNLLDFIGPDTAYVTTWYDQTGNGRHATQTVNATYQPAIVISSVLQQEDGRVAIKFDGVNDYLRFVIPNDIRTAHEIFMVCKNTGNGTPYDSYFGTKSAGYNNVLWHQSDSVPKALGITQPTQNIGNNTTPNPNWKILNAYADSLHNFTFRDLETAASVSIVLTNTSLNFGNMHIGASANHVTFDADWMPLAVHEMIVYTTNKPADRDDMAAAINTALEVY